MKGFFPVLAFVAVGTTAILASASGPKSESMPMSFSACLGMKAKVLADLNVRPGDIREIVNTSTLTMTRVCTADGSLLITCSEADQKMVLTTSPHGADVGCE
jgi:hypothetical protein